MKLENLSLSKKRVLFYLIHFDVFDRLDVMKHSYWTKFSERLGELEKEIGYDIAKRGWKEIVNKFGEKDQVRTYQAINKDELAEVFGGKSKMYLHMAMIKKNKRPKPNGKIELKTKELEKREAFL